MEFFKQLEVWFVVGSQDLYGEKTLQQVAGSDRRQLIRLRIPAGDLPKIVAVLGQDRVAEGPAVPVTTTSAQTR